MENYASIGALLFVIGTVWLLVSIVRLLSPKSRQSAKRNLKFSVLTIVGGIALPIVAVIVSPPSPSGASNSQAAPEVSAPEAGEVIEVAETDPVPEPEGEPDLDPGPEYLPEEIAAREAAEREAAARAASKWRIARDVSAIDDSPIVQINVDSSNFLPARFGSRGPATLSLRCRENTTTATIRFNGHFMADIQGYGRVTYRVDDWTAKTVNMRESTNNEWLGLWSGGQSIPFIRELINGTILVVRATPFNENPMEATFPIAGLDLHLGELRKACNW